MKKEFTLTIVQSTADGSEQWPTWLEKVTSVRAFFKDVCNLRVTVRTLDTEPLFEQRRSGVWQIDGEWYDQHISSKYNTDLVCFVVPRAVADGRVTLAGLMSGKNMGPWELTVFGDENETLYVDGESRGSGVAWFIIHEISHAFYHMLGKQDRTHHFFNQEKDAVWEPHSVLADFIFPARSEEEHRAALFTLVGLYQEVVRLLQLLVAKQQTPAQTVEVADHPVAQDVDPSRLDRFCTAIKEFEGWFPPSPPYPNGSRSYRNNNPGNVKYLPGMRLAIGVDSAGFARFKSEAEGMAFLRAMVKNAATGKSRVYRPEMSVLEYFQVYAPSSDNNHPETYAKYVAKQTGISIDDSISVLVG